MNKNLLLFGIILAIGSISINAEQPIDIIVENIFNNLSATILSAVRHILENASNSVHTIQSNVNSNLSKIKNLLVELPTNLNTALDSLNLLSSSNLNYEEIIERINSNYEKILAPTVDFIQNYRDQINELVKSIFEINDLLNNSIIEIGSLAANTLNDVRSLLILSELSSLSCVKSLNEEIEDLTKDATGKLISCSHIVLFGIENELENLQTVDKESREAVANVLENFLSCLEGDESTITDCLNNLLNAVSSVEISTVSDFSFSLEPGNLLESARECSVAVLDAAKSTVDDILNSVSECVN